MLISYRDSQDTPTDAVAVQAWVRIAECVATQVVCSPQGFDRLQFSRALELCRGLTRRSGSDALRRIVTACAAAGVAVVVVPTFAGVHLSSASTWLAGGGRDPGRSRKRRQGRGRAMIALSLRYRYDDHLYFSLFREAGAILAADSRPDAAFDPDAFARELLIPSEHDAELAAIGRIEGETAMSEAITQLADTLGIAPGLVVGRLQHDGLIPWRYQNHLKRKVDLSYVLEGASAAEETWVTQTEAARLLMRDLNLSEHEARLRLKRAIRAGAVRSNGRASTACRIEPQSLAAWRLTQRYRDLDAEDGDAAAADSDSAASRKGRALPQVAPTLP